MSIQEKFFTGKSTTCLKPDEVILGVFVPFSARVIAQYICYLGHKLAVWLDEVELIDRPLSISQLMNNLNNNNNLYRPRP